MRDFWFTAIAIVLCGVVAMCLLIVGLDITDDASEIPPRTDDNGHLLPPPGLETTTTMTGAAA